MSTHTPGPWRATETLVGHDGFRVWIDGPYVSAFNGGEPPKEIAFVYHSDMRGRANARLIAAAPRMLAILQELSVLADVIALPDALPVIRTILRDVEGSNG